MMKRKTCAQGASFMRKPVVLTVLIAVLLLAGNVMAKDFWLKDSASGCEVWSDEPLSEGEEIHWSGGCKGEKLSGKGVLEVSEGDKRTLRFVGTMDAGKAEGIGTLEIVGKQGPERYEGGFSGSLFDGYGVYELADGSRYEGGFKNDQPDGYGVYKGADGNIYQGEIKEGLPDGKGFRVWPGEGMYEGAFVRGKRHGFGTLLFPNGDVYEGRFKDDTADGAGKFTTAEGEDYEGHWREGKAEGVFVVTLADGTKEEQEWKNDQRVR
jgi:hypothetical protein